MKQAASRLIATVFFVGYLKPGPGTWGSAVAVPLAWVLHGLGGFPLLMAATLLVFLLGWWATAEMTRGKENHDPSEVVVDEVAGQWVALWPLSIGMWAMGADAWVFPYPGWIGAFVAFRIFDIYKIGPVGYFDRKTTAFAAMFDDIVAGIFAALSVAAAAAVTHGLMAL